MICPFDQKNNCKILFNSSKKIDPKSRLYNPNLGGGAILDVGCYPVSFSTLLANLDQTNLSEPELLDVAGSICKTSVDDIAYASLVFEKKIKALCNEVKDKILAKYFLENFMSKINELTPILNFRKNNISKFKKMINPLQKTKEVYKQRNKFEEKELKEFSILFLVINNLDIFRKKIELISEITFTNDIMNEFKKRLIDYLLSEKFFDRKKLGLEDLEQKFKDTINLITINAPIKIICKNKNEEEIILMFNEIVNEIKKIELQKKIESLEDKVSLNLDENLYSELLSLRNQLKRG